MKKTNVLWGILNLIFLIVFNALFFVLGGKDGVEYNTSVWISYGFIHFAYLMLLLTARLIREGKSAAIFGFSLYSISAIYFLVEFVTGIVFILIAPESIKAAFLVQLCIAGLYGIILVSHMLANEYTADAEEKRHTQIAYIKDASSKMKSFLDTISDKESKKVVERVYDSLYTSPVKSHPELEQQESRILQLVNELSDVVREGNKDNIHSIANALLLSINERNNLLKSLH